MLRSSRSALTSGCRSQATMLELGAERSKKGLGGQNRVESGEEQGEVEQRSPKSAASSGADGPNGRSAEDLCCVRPPTGAYFDEPARARERQGSLPQASLFSASESSDQSPFLRTAGRGFSTAVLKQKKSRSSCDDVNRSGKHRQSENNAFDVRAKRGSSSKKKTQASDRK